MNIKDFAEAFNVKLHRDDCGDPVAIGKDSHISDGYGALLGCALEFETVRKWNAVRQKLESAGFVLRQRGDTEGVLTFDPTNEAQARLALRVARIRTRRAAATPTPAQIAAREAFAAVRKAA